MWTPALRVTMVASHLVFVFPIAVLLNYRWFFQAIVWIVVTVVSTMYHACQVYPSACIVSYGTVARWDMTYAMTVMIVVALELIYPLVSFRFPVQFLIVGLFYLVNVGFLWAREIVPALYDISVHMFMTITCCVLILIVAVMVFVCNNRERARRKRDYWRWFHERIAWPWYFGGVFVSLVGVFMYTCDWWIDPDMYAMTHMLWHVGVGVGVGMTLIGLHPYV